MKITLALVLAIAGAALVAIAGTAFAGSQSNLAEARAATAPYHDLDTAKAAGYTFELPDVSNKTCIANVTDPAAGAMGVHMVNLGLLDDPSTSASLDDTVLDPSVPEVLVYEPRGGGLKLVAVEYVVFKAAWDAAHGASSPPTLFGHVFDSNTGARYGLPPFYALHAWIWKPNNRTLDPAGIFAQWNPSVSC